MKHSGEIRLRLSEIVLYSEKFEVELIGPSWNRQIRIDSVIKDYIMSVRII